MLTVAFVAAAAVTTPALAQSFPPESAQHAAASAAKAPPRFPKSFNAKGRYLVPDLDIDVPFTWRGKGGDSQMIAGSEDDPIHFTNVISGGNLYTLTYKWPDISRRPCSNVGPFSVDALNTFLESARFVGAETLDDSKLRHVNHWRVGVVWEPLMEGDFYVDQDDPTTFWKVLHFGLQNLYDPQLDEWMVIDSWKHKPGKVTLPEECAAAAAPPGTPSTPSTPSPAG